MTNDTSMRVLIEPRPSVIWSSLHETAALPEIFGSGAVVQAHLGMGRQREEDSSPLAARVVHTLAGHPWVSGGDLVRPIRAVVRGGSEGTLVVVEPTTGIFGAGADLADALLDFRAALVEHRDVLESSGELAEDLRDQLDFLRRHLRPS